MKLCLIVPFDNLDLCRENGDMFFALTKELLENDGYRQFYKVQKLRGHQVIVDANIHEKRKIPFDQHFSVAKEVGTEIIVPDVMRNCDKTLEQASLFLDNHYDELKQRGIKIQAVPQGKTWEEIRDCFLMFNNDDRIDVIGNSFDLEPFQLVGDKYINQSMNRMLIISEWQKYIKKPIHLLGSNGLMELYLLSKYPFMRSTDGKIFSRLALTEKEIGWQNWRDVYKTNTPKMDFKIPFTIEQISTYRRNIQFFRELIKG